MKQHKLKKLIKKNELAALLNDILEVSGKPMDFWVYGKDANCLISTRNDKFLQPKPELVASVLSNGPCSPEPGFWAEPIRTKDVLIGAVVGHYSGGDFGPLKKWINFLNKQINRITRKEMEKKDILQDSLDKYREINILYNLSEKICPHFLDMDKLIHHALDEAQKNVRAENGSIMLIDDSTDELCIMGAFGTEISKNKLRLKLGEGIAGAVAATGKGDIVNDVHRDPRYIQDEGHIKNLLCVPLKSRDRVFGVINFSNSVQDKPFISRDLKLMGTLATQLATAIENNYLVKENIEKERVKNNLSRYVSQKLVETIMKGESDISLGGVQKNVTILFSDIRGFSSFSEGMEPSLLVEVLNLYFTEMVKIIFEHDGTLDKFVGDMIMVVFGAPVEHRDDVSRAIRTAIDMQSRVREMAREFSKVVGKNLDIGIGINSGEVVAGNIGSSEHMDYTVIGDAVNVAERLEAIAKKRQILVSQKVHDATRGEFKFKYHSSSIVKGRQKSVDIYEVIP